MIKEGSRVRYVRQDTELNNSGFYPPIGTLGTVKQVDDDDYLIKWDKGTSDPGEWYCEHEAVEEEIKMKFNIDDYKGKYVMHCKTQEEARDFCEYLDKIGRCWCSGKSYLHHTNWLDYQSDTVYYFNMGTYGRKSWLDYENVTILEWSDFMEKEYILGLNVLESFRACFTCLL